MLLKSRCCHQKGFTLIELMIVIAILGILSAIAVPNFISYRAKSMDMSVRSEAVNFYSAAMAHYADRGESTTFSASAMPTGFGRNSDISYIGNITVSSQGVPAGVMFFRHTKSRTYYWIWGPSGIIRHFTF